jgi:hypothetical protein
MIARSNIAKSRYKTTFLLHPVKRVDNKMDEVLECIFWRKPELSIPALKFLDSLKETEGIDDSFWEEFCKHVEITRGQYDSIIKKLRGSGLIYKRDGTWKLSDDFEVFLEGITEATKRWRGRL